MAVGRVPNPVGVSWMEIAYAYLARAAEVNPDGTLSVLGADFHIIRLPRFPHLCPMALVVRLVGTPVSDELTFELEIVGPGGIAMPSTLTPIATITPSEARNDPKGVSETVTRDTTSLIVNLRSLVLPAPGEYQFQIRMTGVAVLERRIALLVQEVSRG